MYLPGHFSETRDQALHGLVDAHPFATVLVPDASGVAVNHLPLLRQGDVLRGHVAGGNELATMDGAAVVAVFHGPQGYVSPNWYPSKHETGREVPTWNYAVAHVHGRLRVVRDAGWLRDLLDALTDRFEATEPAPWKVADAPADHVQKLLGAIAGIEIAIERIEGKFKLSQNHPAANRAGVVDGLTRRAQGDDLALAALMQAQEAARA
ncbi:FMN-binding negative transcriptional regulator [Dyella ginsengisoli]|uniref:FMN-binding negative transcriptional regulator n=1 Tax=Dyella ginsengisoli TaxID=363848 RepID=UPI000345F887|nr:FMN-binding negative transcriptional regulator [Dyella ginsengisoli]